MAVHFFVEDVKKPKIKSRIVKRWIKEVALYHGYKLADLNYIFCSDDYLLEINKKYLDHNYYTDIITFDYTEDKRIAGDIFISTDRVQENSITLDTKEWEMFRVIIHGILHLCGYKDHSPDEDAKMRQLEDEALASLKEMLNQ